MIQSCRTLAMLATQSCSNVAVGIETGHPSWWPCCRGDVMFIGSQQGHSWTWHLCVSVCVCVCVWLWLFYIIRTIFFFVFTSKQANQIISVSISSLIITIIIIILMIIIMSLSLYMFSFIKIKNHSSDIHMLRLHRERIPKGPGRRRDRLVRTTFAYRLSRRDENEDEDDEESDRADLEPVSALTVSLGHPTLKSLNPVILIKAGSWSCLEIGLEFFVRGETVRSWDSFSSFINYVINLLWSR